MAKKDENKEIVKAPSHEVVPDYIKKDSKRGSENVDMEDIAIPRLELIQALSPCRKKNDSAYIEGAEEGMMYNNVTRELFEKEVYVCPLMFKKEYLIWKDRDAGGGFRGAFDTNEEAAQAAENLKESGDLGPFDIADTAQHFCLLLAYDSAGNVTRVDEVVLSMSRTKLKVSRQWNSMIRIFGGDRFSRVYKITSVEEDNDKGDYFNFKVEMHGFPPKEIYEKAEKIYDEISAGMRKVTVNRDIDEPDTSAPDAGDVPF